MTERLLSGSRAEFQNAAGTQAGELGLIHAIRRRAGAPSARGLRLGIGDDCALLRLRDGEEIAVTTDLSIAGRHFELAWHPPEAIGHRTLARGLSDLAAMGARPLAAFLSLGMPEELTIGSRRGASWVDRFLNGFFSLAESCATPLAGGDLAQSPIALADIVLVGAVPRGTALLRSGAKSGDLIYVTGSLGGAAAGLAKLRRLTGAAKAGKPLKLSSRLENSLAAHLYPQPRLAQGEWLRRMGRATAALDISDGLSSDLAHICEESGVAARLETDRFPIGRGASLEQALHGGEDYELLFTSRPSSRIPRIVAGVPVTRIGTIERPTPGQPPVMMVTGCVASPLEPLGWQHFS